MVILTGPIIRVHEVRRYRDLQPWGCNFKSDGPWVGGASSHTTFNLHDGFRLIFHIMVVDLKSFKPNFFRVHPITLWCSKSHYRRFSVHFYSEFQLVLQLDYFPRSLCPFERHLQFFSPPVHFPLEIPFTFWGRVILSGLISRSSTRSVRFLVGC